MRIFNAMFGRELGGIEQSFVDYSLVLKNEGHEVISLIHPKAKIRKTLEERDLKYITIPNWGYWDFIAIGRLHKLLNSASPDVIIAHGNRAVWLSRKAATGKFPVIGVCHNYRLKRLIGCDALFSITEDLRTTSIKAGQPEKSIYLIPNMIDITEHGNPVFQEWQLPPSIGTMGRFVHKKGFHCFIEALNILKQEKVIFKAIIAGDGEEKNALMQQAVDYGLKDRITFPGWISNKDTFFKEVDIFCLPSLHEPFGIVLLEAMLNKVPVVSTATEGPREILTDKRDGRLVPPENPRALANALKDLLQDASTARRYANNALETVRNNYAMPVVGKKIVEALNAIVAYHTSSYESKR